MAEILVLFYSQTGTLARMADRMASDAFDGRDYQNFKQPSLDDMMDVETALFVALCRANQIDWRHLYTGDHA